MAGNEEPTTPDELKARVDKAREALEPAAGPGDEGRSSAISVAFRLGLELISGVVVGGLIGWFLDQWLGTSPVFLVIFFAFGAAAGILNVMRTAQRANIGETDGDDDTDGSG